MSIIIRTLRDIRRSLCNHPPPQDGVGCGMPGPLQPCPRPVLRALAQRPDRLPVLLRATYCCRRGCWLEPRTAINQELGHPGANRIDPLRHNPDRNPTICTFRFAFATSTTLRPKLSLALTSAPPCMLYRPSRILLLDVMLTSRPRRLSQHQRPSAGAAAPSRRWQCERRCGAG